MTETKSRSYYLSGETEPVLSRRSVIIGLVIFPFYLLLLPELLMLGNEIIGRIFGFIFTSQSLNMAYYVIMTILLLLCFGKYMLASLKQLWKINLGEFVLVLFIGMVVNYVSNMITSTFCFAVLGNNESMNNEVVSDFIVQSPLMMVVMTVILAPIVEEIIFRAILFRPLSEKLPWLGYVISALLFGLMHVWQAALINMDWRELIYIIQYIPSALILCYICKRMKNIWCSIIMHSLINAVAVLATLALEWLTQLGYAA